jgi:subtilisin family serine protease
MKSILLIAAALLPLATATINRGGVKRQMEDVIDNRYIIKLKTTVTADHVKSFLRTYQANQDGPETESNNIIHTYTKSFFNGFAGEFSPRFLDALSARFKGHIEYIEKDQIATIQGTIRQTSANQPSPPSWGLTRISQRNLDLSAPFVFPNSAGAGVDAWIVDTGCDPSRPDFEGRAKMAKSFVQGEDEVDMNGHGTHVSGTIGSKTYGIAKKANIRCVKVLNGDGSGTYADVVAGVNFVAQNVKRGKTVMNMSLGGPKSQALDDAMVAAIKAGVVAIVAAGNESQDACNVSPAGAPGIMAVGATDRTDAIADFSNVGTCVSILAPGVDITSLWIGDQDTNTISGTSMASPHVVGVAALLMGEKSFGSANDVYSSLKSLATANKITGLDGNTVNKLVYDNSGN